MEEETRLVAAHVAVRDTVAIDDLLGGHFGAGPGGPVLIDEFGERPVLLGDLAVSGLAGSQGGCDLLEGVVKRLVVEEDPIVVVGVVEAILDLADGAGNLPDVAVAGEGDKCGIHTCAWSDRLEGR